MKQNQLQPIHIARAVLARVKAQYTQSPEADLMFAVFRQAVEDYFFPRKERVSSRDSAEQYLFDSDLIHLQLLGIDEEWVCELVCKAKGRILKLKHIRRQYEEIQTHQETEGVIPNNQQGRRHVV